MHLKTFFLDQKQHSLNFTPLEALDFPSRKRSQESRRAGNRTRKPLHGSVPTRFDDSAASWGAEEATEKSAGKRVDGSQTWTADMKEREGDERCCGYDSSPYPAGKDKRRRG
jgi:hypothetical protein